VGEGGGSGGGVVGRGVDVQRWVGSGAGARGGGAAIGGSGPAGGGDGLRRRLGQR
jgi:hypothetical protein